LVYLDPGTSTAIFAFIIGGIAGFGLFIKTRWDKKRKRMKSKE